ncbi:SDR family NAD(P)-dependent oxidoreductase [candidate division KSB1 bacterium]
MIDTGLKGKVTLITGANHGVGAAAAKVFAREGAKVFITFLRLSPEEYGGISSEKTENPNETGRAYYYKNLTRDADEVVSSIRDSGGICYAMEADLSDPAVMPELFRKAEEELGSVDILVNNAAHDQPDTFIPEEELKKDPLFAGEYPMSTITAVTHDKHFAVNSRAVALMTAEYTRRYIGRKAKWGRIINISTDGAAGHASNTSYGASKYAAESYTRAAAHELGPYGITVNVISPGAIQTGWMTPRLEKQIASVYPMRRIGQPEDIADAVIFFASKQADWITGQVLQVGGGNKM